MTDGIPTDLGARAERRCPGCRTWYPKDEGACPMCGHPPAAFNKWLKTAAMNSQLYGQAAGADKERRYAEISGL